VVYIYWKELLNDTDLVFNRLLYIKLLSKCRSVIIDNRAILRSYYLAKVRQSNSVIIGEDRQINRFNDSR